MPGIRVGCPDGTAAAHVSVAAATIDWEVALGLSQAEFSGTQTEVKFIKRVPLGSTLAETRRN